MSLPSNKLPFLPGMTVSVVKPKPKTQCFSKAGGVPGENVKQQNKSVQKRPSKFTATGKPGEEQVPAWLAFAGKVLRFDAYFKEAVTESANEHFRVRRCTIIFHLEDDSILVNEVKTVNSGMPQGMLIRRHRIPTPDDDPDDYYMADDFNVGWDVTFYGRTFHIVNCDQFTRNYLTKMGIQVGEPEDYPDDPFAKTRDRQIAAQRRICPPKPEVDALRQFLQNDRNVLEVYCIWKERRMMSEPRKFKLNYFLSDGQIQIVEMFGHNSGRDESGPFFRKKPLPKGKPKIASTDPDPENYTDIDLVVGNKITVLGRTMTIYSCDGHTRSYFRQVYGIEVEDIELPSEKKEAVSHPVPPYNGFGSEEDSLTSCMSLAPRVPKKDLKKLLDNDRKQIRFAAKMVTNVSSDAARNFVVAYYLADDTVGVFEPVQRNSGIVGGKFSERQKVKNPATGTYYLPKDFYVGAVVQINAYRFKLLEADEYTLNIMESRSSEFPMSDLYLIHDKLRQHFLSSGGAEGLKSVFDSYDRDGSGALSLSEFQVALRAIGEQTGALTEQEIIHLMRHYDKNGDGVISYPEFVSVLGDASAQLPINQADLERAYKESQPPTIRPEFVRDQIREAIQKLDDALRARKGSYMASFREFDADKDSMLTIAEFTRMIDHINIDISDEGRDQLINHFFNDPKTANGRLKYQRFVTLLQRDPAAHVVMAGANAL
eukprot:TRINITY_DN7009_c0_g1_i1.p1 TRINITY_DN7009_c0_g1~~TRINITY_DN7009_c0_g1_i1.p1  ORF type:complete len:712 (-),score=223.43 TRINITY_DN7009_c0_g1_i1:260-2395(-)